MESIKVSEKKSVPEVCNRVMLGLSLHPGVVKSHYIHALKVAAVLAKHNICSQLLYIIVTDVDLTLTLGKTFTQTRAQ